jgi:uncharacterized protein (DUF433 family)
MTPDTLTPPSDTPIPSIREHIVITPGICGGRPRIAGHRITVQHVVLWHERGGLGPDEIVARYPTLTLADIYAALTYYWDHRDEVLAQVRADEEFAEQLKASSRSPLQDKLRQRNGKDDPLPPG